MENKEQTLRQRGQYKCKNTQESKGMDTNEGRDQTWSPKEASYVDSDEPTSQY